MSRVVSPHVNRVMSSREAAFTTTVGLRGRATSVTALIQSVRSPRPSIANPRGHRSWTPLMEIKVGDRVRVLDKGIVLYHFPGKRNEPVPVAGLIGTVAKNISMQDGEKMSATLPYVVHLDDYPKKETHFSESELEVVDDSPSES